MTLRDDLIALADRFDSAGLHKMADEIDKMAIDYSERVQDYRYKPVFDRLDQLFSELRDSPDVDENLKQSLPAISEKIKELVDQEFSRPKHDYYVPEGQDWAYVPEEVYGAAQALAEHLTASKDILEEIDSERNPERQSQLRAEYEGERREAEASRARLAPFRESHPEAYDAAIRYVYSRNITLIPDRRSENPRRRVTDAPPPGRRSTDEVE